MQQRMADITSAPFDETGTRILAPHSLVPAGREWAATMAAVKGSSSCGTQAVVLVSGLPAVGKSTLVGELAPLLGAVALSRDQARLSARGLPRVIDAVSRRLLHRRLRRIQRLAIATVRSSPAHS